ncbi:MAG: hypothetical protein G01um10142_198 [Parcubacteria group bacterium Gr01-1014_2]|nr:MAG: hypothetical protein G01um10142_198 [Parcubacteria group bacterium Gr01-1014_2]
MIEIEVPKEANPQVVVVVPVRMVVVDVPALGVEVAHVDAVAVGIQRFACFRPLALKSLRFTSAIADYFPFFSVFYSGAVFKHLR